MSPVPAFDARGLLPPFLGSDGTTSDRSPYQATMSEIVASLATSEHRRTLLKGLLDYRRLITNLGYTEGLQFADGSFVEDVEAREGRDPDDIDVFSFLVTPEKYRNDPSLWARTGFTEWRSEIVDQARNKQRFKVDSYAITVDQSNTLGIIVATTYWYSLFAHKRVTQDWKGFFRIPLNAADDAAARAALEEHV